MLIFEYPLNERIRTMLRLESVYQRCKYLLNTHDAQGHHLCLMAIFELSEVAGRSELKNELLQDLEKQRASLEAFAGHEDVDSATLNALLVRTTQAYSGLQQWHGKPGVHIRENEWLTNLKGRSTIAGGLCSFDIASYHFWLNQSDAQRLAQLKEWLAPFTPLIAAFELMLELLRNAATMQAFTAQNGAINIDMRQSQAQLIRIALPQQAALVPEISHNKFSIWVRFSPANTTHRASNVTIDVPFQAALCSL